MYLCLLFRCLALTGWHRPDVNFFDDHSFAVSGREEGGRPITARAQKLDAGELLHAGTHALRTKPLSGGQRAYTRYGRTGAPGTTSVTIEPVPVWSCAFRQSGVVKVAS